MEMTISGKEKKGRSQHAKMYFIKERVHTGVDPRRREGSINPNYDKRRKKKLPSVY